MKIAIGGDHYTIELVNKLTAWLKKQEIEFINLGATNSDVETSLQEIIPAITRKVQNAEVNFGILVCGTGVCVEIGANRFKGIRASLCRDAEQPKNARVYDNANVLCLGSWYDDDFAAILSAWLENNFDDDKKRTQMLRDFDKLA